MCEAPLSAFDDLVDASRSDVQALNKSGAFAMRERLICEDYWMLYYVFKGIDVANLGGTLQGKSFDLDHREIKEESLRGKGLYYDFYTNKVIPFLMGYGVEELKVLTQSASSARFFYRQGGTVRPLGNDVDWSVLITELEGGSESGRLCSQVSIKVRLLTTP